MSVITSAIMIFKQINTTNEKQCIETIKKSNSVEIQWKLQQTITNTNYILNIYENN